MNPFVKFKAQTSSLALTSGSSLDTSHSNIARITQAEQVTYRTVIEYNNRTVNTSGDSTIKVNKHKTTGRFLNVY